MLRTYSGDHLLRSTLCAKAVDDSSDAARPAATETRRNLRRSNKASPSRDMIMDVLPLLRRHVPMRAESIGLAAIAHEVRLSPASCPWAFVARFFQDLHITGIACQSRRIIHYPEQSVCDCTCAGAANEQNMLKNRGMGE